MPRDSRQPSGNNDRFLDVRGRITSRTGGGSIESRAVHDLETVGSCELLSTTFQIIAVTQYDSSGSYQFEPVNQNELVDTATGASSNALAGFVRCGVTLGEKQRVLVSLLANSADILLQQNEADDGVQVDVSTRSSSEVLLLFGGQDVDPLTADSADALSYPPALLSSDSDVYVLGNFVAAMNIATQATDDAQTDKITSPIATSLNAFIRSYDDYVIGTADSFAEDVVSDTTEVEVSGLVAATSTMASLPEVSFLQQNALPIFNNVVLVLLHATDADQLNQYTNDANYLSTIISMIGTVANFAASNNENADDVGQVTSILFGYDAVIAASQSTLMYSIVVSLVQEVLIQNETIDPDLLTVVAAALSAGLDDSDFISSLAHEDDTVNEDQVANLIAFLQIATDVIQRISAYPLGLNWPDIVSTDELQNTDFTVPDAGTTYAELVETIIRGAGCAVDIDSDQDDILDCFDASPFSWNQQAFIKASNNVDNELEFYDTKYGWAVAIDGDTMIVGAQEETGTSTTITNGTSAGTEMTYDWPWRGAAYVYRRSGGSWQQEAYLKAPNSNSGERLGSSVAISGDTIAVGSRCDYSPQSTISHDGVIEDNFEITCAGSAYVYRRSAGTWALEAYLKAPNPSEWAQFGSGISIDGDTLVVGANSERRIQTTITNGNVPIENDDVVAQAVGAAYVFKRNASTWAMEAYLKASNINPTVDSCFGQSVAIDQDTLVVGAFEEPSSQTTVTNGVTSFTSDDYWTNGAAYVFKRTGSSWAQEAYLKSPKADWFLFFGFTVDISSNTIVVGGNGNRDMAGSLFIFERTDTTWALQDYFNPVFPPFDYYTATSVAIDHDKIVLGITGEQSSVAGLSSGTGGPITNPDANASGAAFLYVRDGSSWSPRVLFKAPNIDADDQFGASVAISGSTIVTGAPGEDSGLFSIINGPTASPDNSHLNSGAAYIFVYEP